MFSVYNYLACIVLFALLVIASGCQHTRYKQLESQAGDGLTRFDNDEVICYIYQVDSVQADMDCRWKPARLDTPEVTEFNRGEPWLKYRRRPGG